MKINKKQSIILGIAIVAVAGLSMVSSFNLQKIKKAEAGAGDNVSGYAWSENIGWINFNNLSSGGPVDYGVRIDLVTGNFSGYAWSENIGWIQFNPSGDYPGTPYNSVKVDLNASPRKVSGWAKVLAFGDGWDGWIKFDDYGSSSSYIDNNGDFHGWAWGGDVVGWISLNNIDLEAGKKDLYKVKTIVLTHVLSVTKSGLGTGVVTSAPAGINCGSDCSESYTSGTNVALTASPSSAGSTFVGWSGAGCSGTGTCAVTMNAARTVGAQFDNVSPPVDGSCSSPMTHYNCASGTDDVDSNVSGTSSWTWTCQGSNGGTDMQCSELKKKPRFIET